MANLIINDGIGRRIEISATGAGTDADPLILGFEQSVGGGSIAKATTATLSSVSSSASNGTLLAENADRIGVLVVNDSTATLYLKYGATASTSSYTVKLEPGSYWEMPQPIWVGIIDGIWSSANGAARITELE